MVALTPNGEVAQFIDDNQFGPFQSVDKCGPEAVALFWHSVAPGQHNPYSAADVHKMAHDDYETFCGPDVPSDHNGTSNQALYNMLKEHNFKYDIGPAEMAWVKEQLGQGLPVIIGIVESSVVDNQLGANPYNWNTTGLTHIIVASGAGAGGEILVRDTANIATNGVRPGPRHYDANRLQLLSATAVHPSWVTNPPPPPPDHRGPQAAATWCSTTIGAVAPGGNNGNAPVVMGIFPEGQTPNYSTGIAQSWLNEYMQGHNYGPPTSYEYTEVEGKKVTDWNGNEIVQQNFLGGRCEWANGKGNWYKWG